jgi:hypothetical protein
VIAHHLDGLLGEIEIRPHVGTALAADLADETMLNVGGSDRRGDVFAGRYNFFSQLQRGPYPGFLGRAYRGPIVEAACWAHGRRKFFDLARLTKAPIAADTVKRIDVLFAIEREINGLAPQERLRVRTRFADSPISQNDVGNQLLAGRGALTVSSRLASNR